MNSAAAATAATAVTNTATASNTGRIIAFLCVLTEYIPNCTSSDET